MMTRGIFTTGSCEQCDPFGDSSDNTCYEVNADQAFAELPSELPAPPTAIAR
jgi:hypothetical protein